jgi:hypothetical protein
LEDRQGKPEYSEKISSSPTLYTLSPILPDPNSMDSSRGGKLTTSHPIAEESFSWTVTKKHRTTKLCLHLSHEMGLRMLMGNMGDLPNTQLRKTVPSTETNLDNISCLSFIIVSSINYCEIGYHCPSVHCPLRNLDSSFTTIIGSSLLHAFCFLIYISVPPLSLHYQSSDIRTFLICLLLSSTSSSTLIY